MADEFDELFNGIEIDPNSILMDEETILNAPPLSPLNGQTYVPEIIDGQNFIGQISPAALDAVMKVLAILIKEKPIDNIVIRNSKVIQDTGTCIIEADMGKVLNYNGNTINLDIVNPKKNVTLFSQFRNSNDIYIIDDIDNSRYILDNGEVQLFLYKQDNVVNTINTVGHNVSTDMFVYDFVIDKETRKVIKGLCKDTNYIEYLFHDNKIKAIHIPETAIFKFAQYITDPSMKGFNETNADIIVRTSSFLPIDSDQYQLKVYKQSEEDYIIITECKIGGIDVIIQEKCGVTTSGNIII